MLRVAPHAYHDVNAGFGGCFAASGVQSGSMLAEFEHFAGDENAAFAGTRGERLDHGAQRFWIGVVAVIQQRSAVDLDNFTALLASSERFERTHRVCEGGARLKCDGEPSHGIGAVVTAQQVQCKGAFLLIGTKVHMQAGSVFALRKDLWIGAGAFTEVDDATGKVATEL